MKSAKRILSILVAALFLLSGVVSVSAAEVGDAAPFPVLAAEGAVTEVTFLGGAVNRYDGVPDAQALESWSGIANTASYSVSDTQLTAGDVDRDDEVSILDATWIQRYDLGMNAPAGIGRPIGR